MTGLTAVQHDGYATLAWDPVAGATDYQIERTPVDAADVPTGAAVITGLWQGQRTITPDVAEIRRRRLRPRRPLPVAGAGEIRNDDAALFGAGLRDDAPAVGHRARRIAADAMGDERQRDVYDDVNEYATRPRSSQRAHACAWWSSAARTRS